MTDVNGKKITSGDYLILTKLYQSSRGISSPPDQTKVKVLDLNSKQITVKGLYHNCNPLTFDVSYLEKNCIIRKFIHV